MDRCPRCGSGMMVKSATGEVCYNCEYKNETETSTENCSYNPYFLVDCKPVNSITIDCNEIILSQNSLEISLDISQKIDKFDTVIVNGVKFKKVM